MTRRRRQMMQAGAAELSAGIAAPPELFDAESPVWHVQAQYRAFVRRQGWSMPPAERMGQAASPANRRQRAIGDWGRENGYGNGLQPHPDWGRLRTLFGLDMEAPRP